MLKYREKRTIEAEQWFPGRDVSGVIQYQPPDAVIGGRGHGEQRFPQDSYPAVMTTGGPVRIRPGDWVITEISGERDVCDDATFRATYELASN